MKKIIYIFGIFALFLLTTQCTKVEDIYSRFPPEILYKRYVQTPSSGMQWQVSPDAVEVKLGSESDFTVYARVSAPNKLKTISVYELIDGKENPLVTYADSTFTYSPTVYELAYTFTGIAKNRSMRTRAEDMIGNTTTRDFTIIAPTDDEWKASLASRGITSVIGAMDGNVKITWVAGNNAAMQYTTVTYTDNAGAKQSIKVDNSATVTVLPGCKAGIPFNVISNFKRVGSDLVMDSNPKTYQYDNLDYERTGWDATYTSVAPATDGFPDGNPLGTPAWNAHFDGNIRTMLSIAKPGKSVNGSTNPAGGVMYWVIDLKTSASIDYFRIMNRTTDTGNGLKVWSVAISGTNDYQGPVNKHSNPGATPDVDPTDWKPMGGTIALTIGPVETPNMTLPRGQYRYVKVQYMSWDTANNSACQMAEFYLGTSK